MLCEMMNKSLEAMEIQRLYTYFPTTTNPSSIIVVSGQLVCCPRVVCQVVMTQTEKIKISRFEQFLGCLFLPPVSKHQSINTKKPHPSPMHFPICNTFQNMKDLAGRNVSKPNGWLPVPRAPRTGYPSTLHAGSLTPFCWYQGNPPVSPNVLTYSHLISK